MRKGLARWPATLLLVAALGVGWLGVSPVGATALAGTEAAAENSTQPVPLILIHGLGGSGEGFDGPLNLGLAKRFEQAGYIEGETLFPFDYHDDSNGDYVHVARAHLAPLIDRVLAHTGAAQVDLLGYSMGGLVARFLVNQPGEAAKVRTVVLLASPAHGSFAADIVKDAMTTATYLRARPGLGEDLQWGIPPGQSDAVAVVASATASKSGWDQQRYIFDTARRVFEPRLAAFLLQVRFGRIARPLLDFLSWWQEAWPAEKETLFDNAERAPAPGGDLSAAYLHGLALHAAEAYVQENLGGGSAAEPRSPFGLDGAARGRLVEQATTWLGIDPQGLAIDRLLAERFTLGRAAGEATYLANRFLATWNQADTARRANAASGPRYVVLAGTMPNLYGLWWPSVGPNDGAVEAASAWLPLKQQDSFYLYNGSALTSSHPALKVSSQVFDRALAELAPEPRPARRLSPLIRRWWWRDLEWSESGQVTATRWAPTYLDIDASRMKGRSGRLTIEVEAGRSNRGILGRVFGRGKQADPNDEPQVWVEPAPPGRTSGEAKTATSTQLLPLRFTGGRWVGSLTLEAFGQATKHIRVGLRLNGGEDNLPANDSIPVTYRIRLSPGAPETQSGLTPPANAGPGPATGTAPADRMPVNNPPADGRAAGGLPSGPGTIWVRRWNRQTTTREPLEEGHAAWQWDFGDGTTELDDDPAHLKGEIAHHFGEAGTYRVTATSLSNLGQVLRRQTWDVVTAGGQEQRFAFETIRPPWLRLELSGPEKWVTGQPATYKVVTESIPVPWVERQKITVDPAREFQVGWEKPGTYVVSASVIVETTYLLPEGARVTVRSVHRVSRQVRVYTPVLTAD